MYLLSLSMLKVLNRYTDALFNLLLWGACSYEYIFISRAFFMWILGIVAMIMLLHHLLYSVFTASSWFQDLVCNGCDPSSVHSFLLIVQSQPWVTHPNLVCSWLLVRLLHAPLLPLQWLLLITLHDVWPKVSTDTCHLFISVNTVPLVNCIVKNRLTCRNIVLWCNT